MDECAEDTTPPQIITSEYSLPFCFRTRNRAVDFFQANTRVQDECRNAAILDPVLTSAINPNCDRSTITFTARDACGNTATNTAMFPFDDAAPSITVNPMPDPNVCFTSQAVAENAILQATRVDDDCSPDLNIAVSISSFKKDCHNSIATVKAVDLCENVQTCTYQFHMCLSSYTFNLATRCL